MRRETIWIEILGLEMERVKQTSNQIFFIVYKKSEENCRALMENLKQLVIPNGYQVGALIVSSENGRAAAYNKGIAQCDAKYKIYLDEKMRIHDLNILEKLIRTFQKHPDIGALGLAGTKVFPLNPAAYMSAKKRTGRMRIGAEVKEYIWEDLTGEYQETETLDEYFIAMQYDLPWREDLFSGESFCGIAQCMELHRKGYKTAVINQQSFSGHYIAEQVPFEETARQSFLKEYAKEIYPLVTVMIPTFNRPDYLKVALESVIHQTYHNLDIVVTDNSTNELTRQMMQEYIENDSRIQYFYHPDYTSAAENWHFARTYDNPKAEYIQWLMDDDAFAPTKIEKMLNYYRELDGVALVTSYRKLIDAEGKLMPDQPWQSPICERTTLFDGRKIGRKLLCEMSNFIGEPTTVLIRKSLLHKNDLGWTGREGKYLITDFPTWLNLLSQGNMVYITEPLSYFRRHGDQGQDSLPVLLGGTICWALEIQTAWQRKVFLETEWDVHNAILRWMQEAVRILQIAQHKGPQETDVVVLQEIVIRMAQALQNGFVLDFELDTRI